jgi:hypothetical protein
MSKNRGLLTEAERAAERRGYYAFALCFARTLNDYLKRIAGDEALPINLGPGKLFR